MKSVVQQVQTAVVRNGGPRGEILREEQTLQPKYNGGTKLILALWMKNRGSRGETEDPVHLGTRVEG